MLHTLNALPDSSAWRECLQLISTGDDLVLMGDATYGAAQSLARQDLNRATASIYVLALDAKVRGISTTLPQIDMTDLVELSLAQPQQMAWY